METLKRAFNDRRAVVGAVILIVLGLMALLAPLLAQYPPSQLSNDTWLRPNSQHWLGTTALGQDVFSQLLYGSRLSLLVGLVTGLIATAISVIVGLASAFFGGVVDDVLSGITNIFLVLPGLPLVIVAAAYLQVSGVVPVIAVISFTGWAWGARVLRSQALSLRDRDFVQAAIASGEGPLRVIFAEILPNMVGLIAANFFGAALYAVLAEAGLEFLGVGDVSQVTWGTMLYWAQSSQALLQGACPWIATPGLCIAALGTAFALLNFAVDEVANPRLRSERVAAESKSLALQPAGAPPKSDALLQLLNLEAGYLTEKGTVRAVKDVNLEVHRGEFLGIAGESGCGKSTLAFAVAQLLRPPGQVLAGEVWLNGQELVRLPPEILRQTRWKDFSMVFQSSMNALNPVMRVGDQIKDAMRAHGVTDKSAIEARVRELFVMVGIRPEYMSAYPHQLSGGMKQRVVIAIALALEPKLVIMDEPTTALDVVVQRSILQEIDAVRRRLNLSVVFITHDLSLLVEMSDRVAIMYAGEIVELAPSHELYANPLHPYTRRLMNAFPPLEGERTRRDGIAGRPPDLGTVIQGCPFAPRCDRAMAGLCEVVAPIKLEASAGHVVSCHLYDPSVMKGRTEDHAIAAD
jgi:peptide/nickel transport system permease protein